MEHLRRVNLVLDGLAGFLAGIVETVRLVLFYRIHKFIRQTHGNIGLRNFFQICLEFDKI